MAIMDVWWQPAEPATEKQSFLRFGYGRRARRTSKVRTTIHNMASLVLASAYFATVWIGRNVKHEVLAEHLKHLSKRMSEIPEFAAYAIADGLKRAFTRFGKWIRSAIETHTHVDSTTNVPMLPGFAAIFELDNEQQHKNANR